MNRNFYYHNSFIIADRREAHLLETVGRQWACRKVEGFYAISNGLTLEEEYDQCSKRCIEFAKEQGWSGKNSAFSFRKAYSDRFMTFFSKSRVRRNQVMEEAMRKPGQTDVRTAMHILRMEGDPGQTEPFHPARSDMGSVCMHATGILAPSQTAGSLVAEVRKESPSTYWLTGTCIPAISVYIPFTIPGAAIQHGNFMEPSARMDQSLWWRHAALYRCCLKNYPELTAIFHDELKALQEEFLAGEELIVSQGGDFSSVLDRFSFDCLEKTTNAIARWEARVKASKAMKTPFAPIYRCHWRIWNRQAGISC
jgi:dipeptidase